VATAPAVDHRGTTCRIHRHCRKSRWRRLSRGSRASCPPCASLPRHESTTASRQVDPRLPTIAHPRANALSRNVSYKSRIGRRSACLATGPRRCKRHRAIEIGQTVPGRLEGAAGGADNGGSVNEALIVPTLWEPTSWSVLGWPTFSIGEHLGV